MVLNKWRRLNKDEIKAVHSQVRLVASIVSYIIGFSIPSVNQPTVAMMRYSIYGTALATNRNIYPQKNDENIYFHKVHEHTVFF